MAKTKRALAALLAVPLLCLAACADSSQGKLRQATYDLGSAYHVLANPMPDVMAGKIPGVTLTDDQKAIAKRASQTVYNEIGSLETSITSGKMLTETAVSAAQADLASFTACWTGLKTGQTPDACQKIGAN